MLDVIKVASYIFERYKAQEKTKIDEMKLHKLLYFAQRECFIQKNEPLFPDRFEAWKYGPVMVKIRERYQEGTLCECLTEQEKADYGSVFDKVFESYSKEDSWSLSLLTHGETSWKNARIGVPPEANCCALMETSDIRKDAERMKLRRFYFSEILPQLNENN